MVVGRVDRREAISCPFIHEQCDKQTKLVVLPESYDSRWDRVLRMSQELKNPEDDHA